LERLALEPPRVVKRDGSHEAFNEDKLRHGLDRALEKRPVDAGMLEVMVADLCRRLSVMGVHEIESRQIGEAVMDTLIHVDEVAYVRYASVYREFQDAAAFTEEIRRLGSTRSTTTQAGQLSLIPTASDANDE
jgi:transcriptional repressor NrdR